MQVCETVVSVSRNCVHAKPPLQLTKEEAALDFSRPAQQLRQTARTPSCILTACTPLNTPPCS